MSLRVLSQLEALPICALANLQLRLVIQLIALLWQHRYGCIAGYTDGTYSGSHTISRYEFTAGLNACLEKINDIIFATFALITTIRATLKQ